MRRNDGAPGIDKTTLDQVEQYGVTRLLDELATELKDGSYRPLPARRVWIPKPAMSICASYKVRSGLMSCAGSSRR